MKKKILLPILAASLLMLGACNNAPAQSGSQSSGEPAVETARKILKASLSKDTVEVGFSSKVITDVEGCTFRSDNEDVAKVDKDGN